MKKKNLLSYRQKNTRFLRQHPCLFIEYISQRKNATVYVAFFPFLWYDSKESRCDITVAATKKSTSSTKKSTAKKKSASAGTKRRPGTSPSSGTRKRSASGSTARKKTTTQRKQTRKPAAAPQQTWNHVAVGIGMLLLAVILVLALCRLDGILLTGLLHLIGGLIGWSTNFFWIFLMVAGMMILCDMQPVRLRVVCLLLFPVFWSALFHCIVVYPRMTLSFTTLIQLWQEGQALHLGGVIGGMLATILSILLSSIGAKIVLVLMMGIMLFIVCNTTPTRMLAALREFFHEDVEQLREQDMTVTPRKQLPEHTQKKRGNFITFLRNERAKRKAARLKQEQEDNELLEREDQAIPDNMIEQEAFDQAREEAASASRERYEQRMEHKRRLAEVIPDTADFAEPDHMTWEEPAPVHSDIDAPPAPAEEAAPSQKEVHAQVQQEISNAMEAPVSEYQYPPVDLLQAAPKVSGAGVRAELKNSAERLVDTLASFGIDVQIINIVRGPSVTRFEIQMERGVKFSRITSLSDDIALSLGADTVRIAPIPDKLAVGIEVPNKTIQMVSLRDVIGSRAFEQSKASLSVALGKDITGTAQVIDLAKMPHLLIAGTTGSGKSVCINSILISLLYKSSPEDVRLIMIDPKMVELGNYNGIPHLLIPVVTDPKKASGALSWAVSEMERRYALFAATGVRSLDDYNQFVRQQVEQQTQEPEIQIDGEQQPAPARRLEVLPQIVIVIDELADLMMVAAKEVETSICRIAQKARAAGMHLVVATQRPSTDVITGLMKSNIPSRIAFAVASQVESRIILDTTGADKLIGKGDMLYSPINLNKPLRIQGCFVSTDEIERVISHVKQTGDVEYSQEVINHIEQQAEAESSGSGYNGAEDEDELLPEAITIVVESGQASVSMLQRRLKLGYARAARLVDQMEQRGIVGSFEGSKPRKVLLSREDWMQMQLRKKI